MDENILALLSEVDPISPKQTLIRKQVPGNFQQPLHILD